MATSHESSIHPTAFLATVAVSGGLTLAIGAASFVLSFTVLRDLARMAGISNSYAWLLPFIIDGTIMQATLSVITMSYRSDEASRRGRRFFWIMLCVAAAVSISGNAFHAFETRTSTLSPTMAASIATIAPIFLLAMTHGIAVLIRSTRESAAAVDPVSPANSRSHQSTAPVAPEEPAVLQDDVSSDVLDTVRLRHEHPEWSWNRIGEQLGVAASTALRRYRRWEESVETSAAADDEETLTVHV
ncbi:hypothetical protein GCM10007304_46790 [Rhodococcoides trifolii]|uniref:DUF2637 domain-containing protein n=1 Tax=Rhodococcoides trifolii TaxID=908250 RepID=A0A917G8B8_9NOCA|nr:DUF2637 domain-containing protein [Rhodococcus trifolii]GGG27599.1 hypothetical protein GCM10007304_46790 [Rhodococcus trifolii]